MPAPAYGYTRNIHGRRYVTIGLVAKELEISREAVLNWIAAKSKFPAGRVLVSEWIGCHRWFLWESVLAAKKLRPPHRRRWSP